MPNNSNHLSSPYLYTNLSAWILQSLPKYLFPNITWQLPPTLPQPSIYLTFDDGPTSVTPWVLDQLKRYQAKATFFCLGKQVEKYPAIYAQILEDGHQVGNHTYQHLNGWQTINDTYYQDIKACANWVNSPLFRPPYGRVKPSQVKGILNGDFLGGEGQQVRLINYDVLSGDFDPSKCGVDCFEMVKRYGKNGSLVVFHDTPKAWDRLQFALPETLAHFKALGFSFAKIEK